MVRNKTKRIIIWTCLIVYICITIILLISIIFKINFGLLGIISWIIVIGVPIIHLIWCFYNWNYIKKVGNTNNGDKYVGVVLTNNNIFDKIFIYGSGISLLIKGLQKNHTSYKIIKKFELEEFNKFIYDEKCVGVYIIGHGMRHGLKIAKNNVLFYCNFKDAPKKEFVVQLHCNQYNGESLADIIANNENKSYVSDGYRWIYDNNIYFLKQF